MLFTQQTLAGAHLKVHKSENKNINPLHAPDNGTRHYQNISAESAGCQLFYLQPHPTDYSRWQHSRSTIMDGGRRVRAVAGTRRNRPRWDLGISRIS